MQSLWTGMNADGFWYVKKWKMTKRIKQMKRDRQEAVCANSGEICYHVIFKYDLFFKYLWEKASSVAFTM